jgi:uncharacterized protein
MKTSLVSLLLAFIISFSHAQVRSISVEGSAKREVEPDQIDLHITLREYLGKNGQKTEMRELENQLANAIKKLGMKPEQLQLANVYGYNWNQPKEKSRDFMARKEFVVKLSELSKVNQLLNALDAKGIEYVRMGEIRNSKMDEIENQLRAEAILNAKNKAIGMLAPLDEDLGRVLEINEQQQSPVYPVMYKRMNMAEAYADDTMDELTVEMRKISLEVKVYLRFAIKD